VVRPLTLLEPSSTRLRRSPLHLVVCQVRHERNLAVADAGRALAIRDELEVYPIIEEQAQQQVGIVAGPSGLQALSDMQEQRGWRLRSSDGTWNVALLPESYSLECTGYSSWTDFAHRLRALSTAVGASLEPALEQRVGLRYVDRITLPAVTSPQDWHGYINESLLGPILDDKWGASVEAVQQVIQMCGSEAGHRVLLRHGTDTEASGRWAYVLDTDCYRSEARQFDVESVMLTVEDLHRLALQVFQTAVTPKLMDHLRGDEES
jgi:uncharacterized protein (TIGR04255 family)